MEFFASLESAGRSSKAMVLLVVLSWKEQCQATRHDFRHPATEIRGHIACVSRIDRSRVVGPKVFFYLARVNSIWATFH